MPAMSLLALEDVLALNLKVPAWVRTDWALVAIYDGRSMFRGETSHAVLLQLVALGYLRRYGASPASQFYDWVEDPEIIVPALPERTRYLL